LPDERTNDDEPGGHYVEEDQEEEDHDDEEASHHLRHQEDTEAGASAHWSGPIVCGGQNSSGTALVELSKTRAVHGLKNPRSTSRYFATFTFSTLGCGFGKELDRGGVLRSRGLLSVAVVIAPFDLNDVRAHLALMLRRESVRVHVSLGKGPPSVTTARHPPAVRRAARLGQPPAEYHLGQGSPRRVKK
jgi:hypothetical protein